LGIVEPSSNALDYSIGGPVTVTVGGCAEDQPNIYLLDTNLRSLENGTMSRNSNARFENKIFPLESHHINESDPLTMANDHSRATHQGREPLLLKKSSDLNMAQSQTRCWGQAMRAKTCSEIMVGTAPA